MLKNRSVYRRSKKYFQNRAVTYNVTLLKEVEGENDLKNKGGRKNAKEIRNHGRRNLDDHTHAAAEVYRTGTDTARASCACRFPENRQELAVSVDLLAGGKG
jgi:hypothetical protein